jgi:hypothetical protein
VQVRGDTAAGSAAAKPKGPNFVINKVEKKPEEKKPVGGWQSIMDEFQRRNSTGGIAMKKVEEAKPAPKKLAKPKKKKKGDKGSYNDVMGELSYRLAQLRGEVDDDSDSSSDEEDEETVEQGSSKASPKAAVVGEKGTTTTAMPAASMPVVEPKVIMKPVARAITNVPAPPPLPADWPPTPAVRSGFNAERSQTVPASAPKEAAPANSSIVMIKKKSRVLKRRPFPAKTNGSMHKETSSSAFTSASSTAKVDSIPAGYYLPSFDAGTVPAGQYVAQGVVTEAIVNDIMRRQSMMSGGSSVASEQLTESINTSRQSSRPGSAMSGILKPPLPTTKLSQENEFRDSRDGRDEDNVSIMSSNNSRRMSMDSTSIKRVNYDLSKTFLGVASRPPASDENELPISDDAQERQKTIAELLRTATTPRTRKDSFHSFHGDDLRSRGSKGSRSREPSVVDEGSPSRIMSPMEKRVASIPSSPGIQLDSFLGSPRSNRVGMDAIKESVIRDRAIYRIGDDSHQMQSLPSKKELNHSKLLISDLPLPPYFHAAVQRMQQSTRMRKERLNMEKNLALRNYLEGPLHEHAEKMMFERKLFEPTQASGFDSNVDKRFDAKEYTFRKSPPRKSRIEELPRCEYVPPIKYRERMLGVRDIDTAYWMSTLRPDQGKAAAPTKDSFNYHANNSAGRSIESKLKSDRSDSTILSLDSYVLVDPPVSFQSLPESVKGRSRLSSYAEVMKETEEQLKLIDEEVDTEDKNTDNKNPQPDVYKLPSNKQKKQSDEAVAGQPARAVSKAREPVEKKPSIRAATKERVERAAEDARLQEQKRREGVREKALQYSLADGTYKPKMRHQYHLRDYEHMLSQYAVPETVGAAALQSNNVTPIAPNDVRNISTITKYPSGNPVVSRDDISVLSYPTNMETTPLHSSRRGEINHQHQRVNHDKTLSRNTTLSSVSANELHHADRDRRPLADPLRSRFQAMQAEARQLAEYDDPHSKFSIANEYGTNMNAMRNQDESMRALKTEQNHLRETSPRSQLQYAYSQSRSTTARGQVDEEAKKIMRTGKRRPTWVSKPILYGVYNSKSTSRPVLFNEKQTRRSKYT